MNPSFDSQSYAGIKKPGETAEQVENAGMYIGGLERFLVVTAILVQSPSMVGLILTGKSVVLEPNIRDPNFRVADIRTEWPTSRPLPSSDRFALWHFYKVFMPSLRLRRYVV
jgi:hypothetical protein